MGILDKILVGGLIVLTAKGVKSARDDKLEEERRHNTTFCFPSEITQADFELIAINARKKIKKRKIVLKIIGSNVYGTVRSQSGMSEWSFSIDFNDYGKLTGKYWVSSSNEDSPIPNLIAESMQKEIQNILSSH